MLAVVALVIALAIAFAAGYFTRDLASRKRRAEARRWREYTEPGWLRVATGVGADRCAPFNC